MIEVIDTQSAKNISTENACVTDNLKIAVNDLLIELDTIELYDEMCYLVTLSTMSDGNLTFEIPHARIALDAPFKFIACGSEKEAMITVYEIMQRCWLLDVEVFSEWLEQSYPLLSE